MDDSLAISLRGVSKKYRLFGSSRDRLLEALHPFKKRYHREFWALRDISFDVPRGATVGVIGRNGSGKSTLLQVICSILRPTSGTMEVNGRVSALLELGGGFNPEFTGRENVMLNGEMVGFSRAEMRKRLPVIREFADIGEFFEQPVKTYSSGMYVRLAFSAAIHVDPDILIVDEALAVGDAKFQHKCFQKFLEFQRMGRTILFVSHDTDLVVKHCRHALLLDHGRILEQGEPKHVANCYYELLFTGNLEHYSPDPEMIIEGHKGFNILKFDRRFFALDQMLGPYDLVNADEQELRQRREEQTILTADSEEDILKAVDTLRGEDRAEEIAEAGHEPCPSSVEKAKAAAVATRLRQFANESSQSDCCPLRNSYNKNEYRFGDRRAEIIDYLVVCNQRCDLGVVRCGDEMEIYVKAKVNRPVDHPMFGFAIKSVDGVMICGSNTRFLKVDLAETNGSGIIIGKIKIKLDIHSGDYFLDLGIADKSPAEDVPIDIRCSVIHLTVQEKQQFDGLAALDCSFEEILRRE